jgi:hypothetical protein
MLTGTFVPDAPSALVAVRVLGTPGNSIVNPWPSPTLRLVSGPSLGARREHSAGQTENHHKYEHHDGRERNLIVWKHGENHCRDH